MKTMRLAALLVALATPAWANDGDTVTNSAAFEVCKGSLTPSAICAMMYSSETDALVIALANQARCPAYSSGAECQVVRAYIKQRWGY
jgi:hypothetical protein